MYISYAKNVRRDFRVLGFVPLSLSRDEGRLTATQRPEIIALLLVCHVCLNRGVQSIRLINQDFPPNIYVQSLCEDKDPWMTS